MTTRITFVIAIILFALPQSAAAKNVTTWNLMNQEKIEGWKATNITSVQLRPEGLALSTETRGQLVKAANIRHDVDSIRIAYLSIPGAEGVFFWHAKGMPPTEAYQIPISFRSASTPQQLVLDMGRVPGWDTEELDSLGFALEAGSQLMLQSMELSGPGLLDTMVYPVKSFFLFDDMHAYSINFLWGPLMTYGEEQMQRLYSQIPPLGTSANPVFYAVILLALIATFAVRKRLRKPVTVFFLVVGALWVIYDIRMGTEFIRFAQKDIATFWSKPVELRDYRDRGSFNAFAQTVAPYTEGKDLYVFIASRGWPYIGTIQYETYPALPVSYEDEAAKNADIWIVFDRYDIAMDTEGRLALEGKPISPPGKILLPFEPGAFVFVTALQP